MKLETYFLNGEVNPGFSKEFISIFDGWLGKENLQRLDDVSEEDWSRFNKFLRLLSQHYKLYRVDMDAQSLREIADIQGVVCSLEESENKQSAEFTKIAIRN